MTKPQTTTMSREEFDQKVYKGDFDHDDSDRLDNDKVWNYIQFLLTSRDNEWREKIGEMKKEVVAMLDSHMTDYIRDKETGELVAYVREDWLKERMDTIQISDLLEQMEEDRQ